MPRYFYLLFITIPILLSCPALANTGISGNGENADKILTAYTYNRKPFAFEQDGVITGFYPDLFQKIAERAGIRYQIGFAPSIKELYRYAETGKAAFVFCGIKQDPAFISKMDFTYSVNHTGLQLMVAQNGSASLEEIVSSALDMIFSRFILYVIVFVLCIAFLAGHIMWLCERRKENSAFSRSYFPGVLKGLWWGVETITSVGYGQNLLQSKASKTFGVLFMIIGTCLFAVVVSVVTTKMTLHHMQNKISGPGDLYGKTIGIVEGSPFEDYANSLGGKTILFKTLPEAAESLAKKKINCVLDDSESLRWFIIKHHITRLELVGPVFNREFYAIGLPKGSPWLDKINQAILKVRSDNSYDRLYDKWFGQSL